MNTPTLLMAIGATILLNSCTAEDSRYFWNGPADGNYKPAYTRTWDNPGTTSPTFIYKESEDQKMRNYGQQLDRKINREIW